MKTGKASKGVLSACKPRPEVLEGELADAIFAADFGQLIDGSAPRVYGHAETFFRNTEPTPDLKSVCAAVFKALADKKEAGQLIRLSTGFGGGKTHTLMALWHLADNVATISLGTELLPAAGRPKTVKVVAVDAGKAGIPVFATHGATKTHSLQGEIVFQLGGAAALKALGAADHHEASPDEAAIAKALGDEPLLILLDELVVYMAGLSAAGQGNFMSFLGKLVSGISKRKQAVLVITDPGQQTAYAGVSQQLAANIGPASAKLEDILGRKMTDFDPVGKQAARVIARRLFDQIDPSAAAEASAAYHQLYQRVREAHPNLLPASAVSADYAKRIEECYPFHPRLIHTAKERLGPLPEFQRSRGVLRLFARIIRDIWENERALELITAGDINWASPAICADLLQRLRREQFSAAVQADIEGHAFDLDDRKPGGVHCRVASALLLESLPRTEHSGLDPAELTLATLRTEEAGQEPSEALDRLLGACWHTYPMAGGRGWQFRFEPNVIKQIEQRAALVDPDEARDRVFAEAHSFFAGPLFSLASWPDTPRDVLERKELQLALCATTALAEEVCAYADKTDPTAPVPRRFRNSIVAIAPHPDAFANALERAKRIIAAEQIEKAARPVETSLGSATNLPHLADRSVTAVVVDPPYADNVQYAELADFFYVWLKRTQGHRRPEWFSSYLCDHTEEAVVNVSRFRDRPLTPALSSGGGEDERAERSAAEARGLANAHYQRLMGDTFRECRRILRDDGVLTVMFTHKKQEAWEALFTSLVQAGFTITATWPVKTESEHSLHQAKKNAAQSTVILVARKRDDGAEVGYFDAGMRRDIRLAAQKATERLQMEGLNPVDQLVGSFGPAMEVYSRYSEVRTDTGDPVGVDRALDEASEAVTAFRIQQLSERGLQDVEAEGRFYLLCWDVLQAAEFRFNEAKLLGHAVGMDVDSLAAAGLVSKSGDKIKLLCARDRRRPRKLEQEEIEERLFGALPAGKKKRVKKGDVLKVHPNDAHFRTALDACHALALRYLEAGGGNPGLGSARQLATQQGWKGGSPVARLMEALLKAAPPALWHEKGKNSAAAEYPEFRAWHAMIDPLFGVRPPEWFEPEPGLELALQYPEEAGEAWQKAPADGEDAQVAEDEEGAELGETE